MCFTKYLLTIVLLAPYFNDLDGQVLVRNDENIIPIQDLNRWNVKIHSSDHLLTDSVQWLVSHYSDPSSSRIKPRQTLDIFMIRESDTPLASHMFTNNSILCYVGVAIDTTHSSTIIYLDSLPQWPGAVRKIFGAGAFITSARGPYDASIVSTPSLHRIQVMSDVELAPYRPLSDSIDAVMKFALDSMTFPGAQVVVLHQGRLVHHDTYGFHSYQGVQEVRWTDLYDLASVTKVATATPALMYLYDQSRLDLDANLCSLFPILCNSNKGVLLLREVLAHQARLIPYIVYWQSCIRKNGRFKRRTFRSESSGKYSVKICDDLFLHNKYRKKINKAIRKSDLNPEPGYVYSGLTFLLYPDFIYDMTGLRIDSFMYQTFYDDLGAGRLTYRPLDRFGLDEIVPTEVDTFFRHQPVHGYVHDEAAAMLDGLSTNAGLFANALDLAKYGQMLLNGGSYGGKQFFSPSTVEEFTRAQFAEQNNRRGLGWDKPPLDDAPSYMAPSASPDSFGHSGFTGTYFWVDPANETVLVLLSNRVNPTRNNRKLYSLNIRPDLHEVIYSFLRNKS